MYRLLKKFFFPYKYFDSDTPSKYFVLHLQGSMAKRSFTFILFQNNDGVFVFKLIRDGKHILNNKQFNNDNLSILFANIFEKYIAKLPSGHTTDNFRDTCGYRIAYTDQNMQLSKACYIQTAFSNYNDVLTDLVDSLEKYFL